MYLGLRFSRQRFRCAWLGYPLFRYVLGKRWGLSQLLQCRLERGFILVASKLAGEFLEALVLFVI